MLRTTVRALACAIAAAAVLALSGPASATPATTPTITNLTTGADSQAYPPDTAVGDTLRGYDHDWAGSGVYAYQWHRCWDADGQVCEVVAGATTPDYTTTALDWGLQMKFCAEVPRFDTKCSPNTRIIAAEHTDSDRDGVPDYADRCPTVAGNSNGCSTPPTAPGEVSAGPSGSEPLTTPASPIGLASAAPLSLNGVGATTAARLTIVSHRSRSMRVGFRKRAAVHGRLLDASGHPITGASVDVLARRNVATAQFSQVSKVVTASDGRFTYVAPAGSSRVLRFAYRAFTTDTAFSDSTEVTLLVSGAVTLKAKRKVRNRTATAFRGRLLGKPVPPGGVLVDLQVWFRNKWRTFATPRTNAKGAFRFKYRFTQGPARWVFRARIRKDSLYPYEMSYSRKVAVLVTR